MKKKRFGVIGIALAILFLLGAAPSVLLRYSIPNTYNKENVYFAKQEQKKNAAILKRLQRFSFHILLCFGHLFVLCFDFLNLFCRSGDYPQSFIAHIIKQAFKLSALC